MNCDFVEIGTCSFDTLTQQCAHHAVGIAVEPLTFYLDQLPNKPNVIKEGCAISNQRGTLDMYYVPPEDIDRHLGPGALGWKGCNSLGKPHASVMRVFGEKGLAHLIKTRPVPVITFSDLMEKHNVASISLLKLDTEGHDCQILENVIEYCDAHPAVWPNRIKFESNVLTERQLIDDTIAALEARGYVKVDALTVGEDTVMDKIKTAE